MGAQEGELVSKIIQLSQLLSSAPAVLTHLGVRCLWHQL